MLLQDLPLEILIEIAKLHPWVGCELSKTIREVGLYSIENDAKRWFKIEEANKTFILIKYSKAHCYYKKLHHSWDDKPSIIQSDGTKQWHKEDKLHRDYDKPAIIDLYGTHRNQSAKPIDERVRGRALMWFKEGKLHRDGDNPSIIYFIGAKEWFKEGKRHRDNNQPAIIHYDGRKQWYKEGNRYSPR